MQKPIVFNRHLNKKWGEKENDIMVNKLSKVKAKIDVRCPESFVFYKTQFRKTQMHTSEIKEYELRKNNQVLVEKIMNIFTTSHQKELKKRKPLFAFKQNLFSQTRKWDLFKITQENQHLLKRLNERQSLYNSNKWEKDYDKSQTYKKNICVFPSITFNNPNKDENFRFPCATSQNFRAKSNSSLYNKLKMSNFNFNSEKNSTNDNFFNTGTNFNVKNKMGLNSEDSNTGRKLLWSKNVFLGELFHCVVYFSVENKRFIIEVEANSMGKNYFIVFDDLDEIVKIQKLYKKYEQIITDIEYDIAQDRIFINNLGNVNLVYNSFVVRKERESKNDQEREEDKYDIQKNYSSDSKNEHSNYKNEEKIEKHEERNDEEKIEKHDKQDKHEHKQLEIEISSNNIDQVNMDEEMENIENNQEKEIIQSDEKKASDKDINKSLQMSMSATKQNILKTEESQKEEESEVPISLRNELQASPKKRVSINDKVLMFETNPNNLEEGVEYISYSKAKESSKTLSRGSFRSNKEILNDLKEKVSEYDNNRSSHTDGNREDSSDKDE